MLTEEGKVTHLRQHERIEGTPNWTVCEAALRTLRLIVKSDRHGNEVLVLSGRMVARDGVATEGFVYYDVDFLDLCRALRASGLDPWAASPSTIHGNGNTER